MKHACRKAIKLLVVIGVLVLLVWLVDVQSAVALLKETDWRWLALALLVVQLQIILSALRWKITANRLGQRLSSSRAISEYYLATFTNLSVPGGVVGDAARVYRNRVSGDQGISIHSVVLERLSGQIALVLVVVVGWLLWPWLMDRRMPYQAVQLILTTFIAVTLVAFVLLFLLRYSPERLKIRLLEFQKAAYFVWVADRQWILQGALSFGIVFTYLMVFWLCSYAVGAPLPLAAVLTLVPLVLLSMLIPITIGGWGIREAAAALLWPFVALTPEAGVVSSIVYAVISWLGCIPGLLLVLLNSLSRAHRA